MKTVNNQVTDSVTEFLDELAKDQEPLGDDFEKVLKDNLWEMLEE